MGRNRTQTDAPNTKPKIPIHDICLILQPSSVTAVYCIKVCVEYIRNTLYRLRSCASHEPREGRESERGGDYRLAGPALRGIAVVAIRRGVALTPGPTLALKEGGCGCGAWAGWTGATREAAATASSFCARESAEASARSIIIGSLRAAAAEDDPAPALAPAPDPAAAAPRRATGSGPSCSSPVLGICPALSLVRRSNVRAENMPSRKRWAC